jgi:Concanavalin A-like lectin/glucanases superfamily
VDLPVPSLILDPAYPVTVMASGPWSYWRFESLTGGSTPNEVPGRPPLLAAGPVSLTGKVNENQVAVYKPGEDCQYLAMAGPWEPAPDPGYAVELWFLPDSIDHASLVSMTAPQDTNNHRYFLETGSRNRHTLHKPAAVRFLDRWPSGREGGRNIYSTPHYVPGRWHHLVGQMNRGRMELYLDEEPTYSLPADPVRVIVACQVLFGRLSTVNTKDHELHRLIYSRPFVGRLDEVALYNHPLSIEEIRRHHRLATQRVTVAEPPLTRPAASQSVARGPFTPKE